MHYDKRLYGKTKNIHVEELKKTFASLEYVKIALLFGSRATKGAKSKSDYDFALWMDNLLNEPWGMKAKAWSEIPSLLGIADYDIDIIDLRNADKLIKSSINKAYIVIKGDHNEIRRILNKNY